MKRLSGTALLLAALAAGIPQASAQKLETVSIPGGQRFSILVPAGYSYRVERDMENNAAVYMENPIWEISVTAFLIASSDPEVTSGEWQRDHLISRLADVFSVAKESDYNFKPLGPSRGTGTYCVFTDSKYRQGETLPPGEFMHLTGGVKARRGAYVFFQIMSNDLTSPEYQEAFELFRSSFD